VRAVFWNTWLLRPRLWRGGPAIPGGEHLSLAPDVTHRAPLVGAALAGRFDVCALGELFEESEQGAVRRAWDDADAATGPGRRGPLTGSGLVTVVDRDRARLVHTATHAYRSGGDLRDSDSFATKGALLTRIAVRGTGAGDGDDGEGDEVELDVVSTHLFAGGDLFPIPGADDRSRHHRARMAQVDELVAFVQAERDPALPLLLVGDLNVPAHDPDPVLDHPEDRYRDLLEHLAPLAATDLWAAHGIGPGPTCTFAEPADLPPDPDEPDRVVDRPDGASADDPSPACGERIDYLFLAPPATPPPGSRSAAVAGIQVDRPRRWAFPGREPRGGVAGSLSDHLALSVTLHLPA
jgi:hypothetical protein